MSVETLDAEAVVNLVRGMLGVPDDKVITLANLRPFLWSIGNDCILLCPVELLGKNIATAVADSVADATE